ncbi:hypothetical protein [Nocardiopsis synnemataformans]|uniref:hypothetical protein n=1 Tax=Nocardiopsis synnemataformans TaxID=61305 RepID=UPI003EBFAC49
MSQRTLPRRRLLLLDGSPGATTLLVLAAHGALPRFDAVLAPDTGWYPTHTYRYLDTLRPIATDAAMEWARADTGSVAQDSLGSLLPCPLPLFTLTADGIPGRLPQGCARRQAQALTHLIRRLLGYPRQSTLPDGIVAECAVGLGVDHTYQVPAGPPFVVFRYPLAEIGWTARDCRAFLHHHGLGEASDLACVACPNRSDHGWAHLRATDPEGFAQAVAVDTTLRHGHPNPALRGMPLGTTYFLHPDRVPLDQVDLTPDTGFAPEGCKPWACRGDGSGTTLEGGGGR